MSWPSVCGQPVTGLSLLLWRKAGQMEANPDDPFPAGLHQTSHFTPLSLCFLVCKMGMTGLLRTVSELKKRST